jgi:hypothetical protein
MTGLLWPLSLLVWKFACLDIPAEGHAIEPQPADDAPRWIAGLIKNVKVESDNGSKSEPTPTVYCGGAIVGSMPGPGMTQTLVVLTAKHCVEGTPGRMVLGRSKFDPAHAEEALSLAPPENRAWAVDMVGADLALLKVPLPAGYDADLETAESQLTAPANKLSLYVWGGTGRLNRLWRYDDLEKVADPWCGWAWKCTGIEENTRLRCADQEIGFCAGRRDVELVSINSGGALVADGKLVGILSGHTGRVGRFNLPLWCLKESPSEPVHPVRAAEICGTDGWGNNACEQRVGLRPRTLKEAQ